MIRVPLLVIAHKREAIGVERPKQMMRVVISPVHRSLCMRFMRFLHFANSYGRFCTNRR
jgi:hypothetical protein